MGVFLDAGASEDRRVSFHEVFAGVEKQCRKLLIPKIHYSEMDSAMEVLQNYNIIEIDKSANKKDSKTNKFILKVELDDLFKCLTNLLKEQRNEISP